MLAEQQSPAEQLPFGDQTNAPASAYQQAQDNFRLVKNLHEKSLSQE